MTSLAAKKTVKTYARQTKRAPYDEEPPTKRRRVQIAIEDSDIILTTPSTAMPPRTSSPSHYASALLTSSPRDSPAIFSDELPRSSPPSSPVPQSSPPALQKRRPVFSFLKMQAKRKTPSKRPLLEQSDNMQSMQQRALEKKKKSMVQMQLDLVGQHRKACKTCGMEYIPSNTEDAAMHKKFHAMNFGGVDFTKAAIERFRKNQAWSGGDGSFIAVVGRKDAVALRKRASDVLKVVNTELAAVPIADEELWGQAGQTFFADAPVPVSNASKSPISAMDEPNAPLVDRFRVFLYLQGNKCVGACLAERIWEAFTVLAEHDASEEVCQLPSTAPKSSSISISSTSDLANLGISRIWTSNQHRKQGVATRLLDTARSNFIYGLTVEKDKVAFSQPTESGGKLARKWFGRDAGWHVYID